MARMYIIWASSPRRWFFCHERRALLLVDPPAAWDSVKDVQDNLDSFIAGWTYKKNAALYFPRLRMPDPLQETDWKIFLPVGP